MKINNSSGIDSAIWAEIPDPGKFNALLDWRKKQKLNTDIFVFINIKMLFFFLSKAFSNYSEWLSN